MQFSCWTRSASFVEHLCRCVHSDGVAPPRDEILQIVPGSAPDIESADPGTDWRQTALERLLEPHSAVREARRVGIPLQLVVGRGELTGLARMDVNSGRRVLD